MKKLIAVIMCISIIVGLSGCNSSVGQMLGAVKIEAKDISKDVKVTAAEGRKPDAEFANAAGGFAAELFKRSFTRETNSLISPTSVMYALAMTANGAEGGTLSQMEETLGGLELEQLNRYLRYYAANMPDKSDVKLKTANSIWFRDNADRIEVKEDFLEKNAAYYAAQVYKSPFDGQTLKDINGWVKINTDGMIKNIIDEIPDEAIMYLINAVVFDAKWEEPYKKDDVRKQYFNNLDGSKETIDFMHSEEKSYISDENATGFIKPYKGGRYGFAALLPNEGVDIGDYIASFTGEGLGKAFKNVSSEKVITAMPKFTGEFSIEMKKLLADMGMIDAFNTGSADFSGIGSAGEGNIYISEVIHKTFIEVDEQGTRAAAATAVGMSGSSMPPPPKQVILDRPFVYAIIDTETGIPAFIGAYISGE